MSTVREIFGADAVTLYDPSKSIKDMVAIEPIESKRIVGIEVEVENHVAKKAPSSIWNSVADGSLRNNGVEYITRPIMAMHAPFALEELLGKCLDEKECCFSPRTSIHVHVNMQDVDETAVINITCLYAVFEKLFFKFTGRGRIKNIYCVPVIDTEVLAHAKTLNLPNVRSQWNKYSALNLLPLSEHGTIEFRHMHGTFNVSKVSIWVRLITKLVDYVVNATPKFMDELFNKMDANFDYAKLLNSIFGADAEYLKYQHFIDVQQGVGRMATAYTSLSTTRMLLELRDTKSPYFLGGI